MLLRVILSGEWIVDKNNGILDLYGTFPAKKIMFKCCLLTNSYLSIKKLLGVRFWHVDGGVNNLFLWRFIKTWRIGMTIC